MHFQYSLYVHIYVRIVLLPKRMLQLYTAFSHCSIIQVLVLEESLYIDRCGHLPEVPMTLTQHTA